jgi:S1-C subfamily serine protease
MERIVVRHLSGSKANQVEEFPLNQFREVVFGRDPSAAVRYDPDRDDLVGRQHAKIVRDSADPSQFSVVDLNSRNGTFVNKQRIVGSARISPGDLVQFGAGGPEFQFDLEPRPESNLRATRVGDTTVPYSSVPPTRVGDYPTRPGSPLATVADGRVGKATVERMIAQTKSESRKGLVIAGVGLAFLVVAVAAVALFLYIRSHREIGETREAIAAAAAGAPMSPGAIVEKYGNSVVYIEVQWKLFNTQTGRQVYHLYVPNRWRDRNGVERRIVNDSRPEVATYMVLSDNTYEPALTDQGGTHPIGGGGGGTGFSVTNDGFILTARHVGAGWMTRYHYTDDAYPGVVWVQGPRGWTLQTNNETGMPMLYTIPTNWVPSQTRQFGRDGMRYPVEGKHEYLNITFPKNQTSIPGKLARVSDRHDVALLKIDLPDATPKCELNDNYETIKAGDSITVLGYPAVSPVVFGTVKSQDVFNRESQYKMVPEPSLTTGNIGRVLRGQDSGGGSKDEVISEVGDVYQVTANPGPGNSGGPVFDSGGKVVGIYFAARTLPGEGGGAQVSFAVPIRFAKELMTATPK